MKYLLSMFIIIDLPYVVSIIASNFSVFAFWKSFLFFFIVRSVVWAGNASLLFTFTAKLRKQFFCLLDLLPHRIHCVPIRLLIFIFLFLILLLSRRIINIWIKWLVFFEVRSLILFSVDNLKAIVFIFLVRYILFVLL